MRLANQLKAIELDPTDATAEYNLALTYLKLKRKDEVLAARDKLGQMNARWSCSNRSKSRFRRPS